MGLPLPRVVADVGPGGPLVTALGGMEDLRKKHLENQYYGQTAYANALSKMAYANLMGPQFLAKLMGNDSALANMTPEQRKAALDLSINAGMGQGTANGLLAQNQGPPAQESMNPFHYLNNALHKLFGGNAPSQQLATPEAVPTNALLTRPGQQSNLSPQDQQGINNLTPGQSYVIQGNQGGNPSQVPAQTPAVDYPEDHQTAASMNQPSPSAAGNSIPENRYAEKTGQFKGVVEEGKELGKQRAENIGKLDDEYASGLGMQTSIDKMIKDSQNPIFKELRSKIPFFQDKQLSMLSKIGTPEEQEIIGNFIGSAKRMQAETIKGFGSRVLATEFSFTDKMKISENDTWNTMLGKLSAASYFNQYSTQRARLASQLMQSNHLNKGDALQAADKQMDGAKIRQGIDNQLHPKPTEKDINYMAEKYKVSVDEIKKRLQAKGLL